MPLSVRITLGAIGLVLVAMSVATYLMVEGGHDRLLATFGTEFSHQAENDRLLLEASLTDLSEDGLFLARSVEALGLPDPGAVLSPELHEILETQFYLFTAEHPDYQQVRLIGLDGAGMEWIRVQRHDGQLQRVPSPELQAKRNRDYFQAALDLAPGEVYLSEINLNREHDAVEVPHRRMTRVATLAYGPGGAPVAMAVINFDIGGTLDRIAANSPIGGTKYLTNAQGAFLVHPDTARTFGFDLGQPFRFSDEFEGLSLDALSTKPVGSHSASGTQAVLVSSAALPLEVAGHSKLLFVAASLPESTLSENLAALRNRILLGASLASALICAVFWFWVRNSLAPLNALAQASRAAGAGHFDFALPSTSPHELGALVDAFGSMQTSLQDRERALLESNRLAQEARELSDLVIETTPAGILLIGEDGLIERANAGLTAILGYGNEELAGQPVECLVPERLRTGYGRLRQQFMNESTVQEPLGSGREFSALHKSGHEVMVEICLAKAGPDHSRVVATLVDIGDRKAREEQRLAQRVAAVLERQVAERTNELWAAHRELEGFAEMLSHDLRTPGRIISGLVEKLSEDLCAEAGQPARETMELISQNCRILDGMIRGLLSLARGERGELEMGRVNLSDMCRKTLLSLAAMEPRHPVRWDIEPGLEAWADPRMVQLLLDNLLRNAWKFTRGCDDPTISLNRQPTAEGQAFCVQDNGVGFDPALADSLFRMYSRHADHNRFPGSGIGLATVKRIVLRHGGQIWAEGETGLGARFYFTLPLVPNIEY